ncbi:hypothetical protein ACHAQH_006105 [Verticillium albo-atrum]
MTAIKSFRLFLNLVKHADPVLVTLGKMRLSKVHSVEALHGVLVSSNCVACGQLGAFICIPTCERACLDCLDRNIRFWVLKPAEARKIYCLRVKDVVTLPTMWTVKMSMHGSVRRQKMVSERHAAQLALKLHGVEEDPGLHGRSWSTVAEGDELLEWLRWSELRGIPGARDCEPPRLKTWGFGFMRMPYLGPGVPLEHMNWCEGCMAHTYSSGYEIAQVYRHGDVIDTDLGKVIDREIQLRQRNAFRAWTLTELLQHIPDCAGVPWLKQQKLLGERRTIH